MIKSQSYSRHCKIDILFEDEYLCVINKPAGLLSVPNHDNEKSALGLLEEIMRKKGTFSSAHRPFAVHRLDRETSGVMMFALSESARQKIMDTWHKMVSERLYRAVAENPGNPRKFLPDSGLIDDDLAFNAYNMGFVPKKGAKFEKNVHFERGGKNQTARDSKKSPPTVPARTRFTTILRGETHTLFELSLDTGKKNQIRAHLASKGYPLAGDKNYRAQTDHFHRLCLHARTLCFAHPFTGRQMRFEVPENPEWKAYVESGDTGVMMRRQAGGRDSAHEEEPLVLGKKRLSAKDKAHMNFIEIGKFR